MRRAVLSLAALAVLAACGGGPPLPDQDLLLRVSLGAEEVISGQAFPVTVVRAWSKDLEPSAWDDRALAPLVLRLEDTTRREDERHVEETRRYRAYAFARSDVLVPAAKLTARPRDGGPEHSVTSQRRRLRVRPAVNAALPGPPELPGEPLPEPFPWLSWAVGAGVAITLLLVWAWRRRARTRPPVRAPAAPASPPRPDVVALRRLRAIAERPAGPSDVVDISDALRDYVAARFAVPARERTSEEVLAALDGPRGPGAAGRARLADLLARCDAVKFGGHAPTLAERAALLADAEAFVTAPAAGSAP